jgi:pimeloyl-ACP methyl ester carboxylesterase
LSRSNSRGRPAIRIHSRTNHQERLDGDGHAPGALHAGFEYYRAFEVDAADNAADATVLQMPVLTLGGDHSAWKTFLREQLEGRAGALTGDVVPECGHFVPEEQPAWLSARLEAFFAGS